MLPARYSVTPMGDVMKYTAKLGMGVNDNEHQVSIPKTRGECP